MRVTNIRPGREKPGPLIIGRLLHSIARMFSRSGNGIRGTSVVVRTLFGVPAGGSPGAPRPAVRERAQQYRMAFRSRMVVDVAVEIIDAVTRGSCNLDD